MDKQQVFSVRVTLPGNTEESAIKIEHIDETYQAEHPSGKAMIINNGDNSWSLVSGDVSQETVNLIGQAIEDFYKERQV